MINRSYLTRPCAILVTNDRYYHYCHNLSKLVTIVTIGLNCHKLVTINTVGNTWSHLITIVMIVLLDIPATVTQTGPNPNFQS